MCTDKYLEYLQMVNIVVLFYLNFPRLYSGSLQWNYGSYTAFLSRLNLNPTFKPMFSPLVNNIL